KAVIMPCLIELGRASASVHKNIGEKIDKDCQLGIITTKEFFEQVKGDSNKIFSLSDPDEILRKIESTLSKGDSILIEGRINKEIASKIYEANLNIIKP
ncbi:hypothetical protein KKG36_02800, partial [Patescibacteria group bacterium]|nr:hypothetical protein [Patescibacteria group bacterium]